jgi:hypothetical protein
MSGRALAQFSANFAHSASKPLTQQGSYCHS